MVRGGRYSKGRIIRFIKKSIKVGCGKVGYDLIYHSKLQLKFHFELVHITEYNFI